MVVMMNYSPPHTELCIAFTISSGSSSAIEFRLSRTEEVRNPVGGIRRGEGTYGDTTLFLENIDSVLLLCSLFLLRFALLCNLACGAISSENDISWGALNCCRLGEGVPGGEIPFPLP
jgi:hypothetical protein